MYTSDDIYILFRERLKEKLHSISLEDFELAWKSGLSCKTLFYENLFSEIGRSLSANVSFERFRCDVTISDGDGIPLILIEMENAHSTASTEIEQLCCLNAPLKVLVISCEWYNSERDRWLPVWQEIIKKYNMAYPTNSKFCIVVGEWGRGRGESCDDILRYYLVALSSVGTIIDDLEWRLK